MTEMLGYLVIRRDAGVLGDEEMVRYLVIERCGVFDIEMLRSLVI